MKRKIGKFRIRIFILVFALSFSSLVIFTLIGSNQMANFQREHTYEDMSKNALAIKTQVDQNMINVKNLISVLSRTYTSGHGAGEVFDKTAQEIIKDVTIITQVYVMNVSGMQIYKSSFPETMGDRSDREYFQQALLGESVFSDVIISRSTNVPIVVHAQPLIEEGEIVGVIGASIDLSFLSSLTLLSYSNPESSYGYVVDSDGRVIGHPDAGQVEEMLDISYLEPVSEVLNGKSGNGIYTFSDIDKLVSYTPSDFTEWGILYQVPKSEAYEMIRKMVLYLSLSSIIISVFALASSLEISRLLNKPIKKIISLINIFTEKNEVPLEYKISDNEFGVIEGKLISMTDKIKAAQINLEEKINDRTKELTTTMDKLVIVQNELLDVNKELKEVSLTDKLTGLPNRRSFDAYLMNFWRLTKRNDIPGAVLMIDIDHFKFFNDTYGHVEGDNCLKVISEELMRLNKRESDYVARYGGEEFIIILNKPTYEYTVKKAESICKEIEGLHYKHGGHPDCKWVTVSVGAFFISDTKMISMKDAVTRADAKLYQAKDEGRNRFVIDRI